MSSSPCLSVCRRAVCRAIVLGAVVSILAPVALAGMSSPAFNRSVSAPVDILDRIRALSGIVSAVEAPTPIHDARYFMIEIEQPVDHGNPDGPKFRQRLTLLHRSETAPMVIEIEGYYGYFYPSFRDELSALLDANQIDVEHRFFVPSVPDPLDWHYLTIAQAAADHHRIIETFKNIYDAKWISTGLSKGGMASVYHRYFYPDDVVATVPYSAPTQHGTEDARYIAFVDSLGSKGCRSALRAVQKAVLKHRAEIRPLMRGSYTVLGKDKTLEFEVSEFPFGFWQYQSKDLCGSIPSPASSVGALYTFLDRVVGNFDDEYLNYYAPYYYQAATELGAPAYGDKGISKLLRFPGQHGPENFPPLNVDKPFDPTAMPKVEDWVLASGTRLLFIYGENDPLSANGYAVAASNDSYHLSVRGTKGNHLGLILDLPASDRDFALAKLQEWMGVPVVVPSAEQVSTDRRTRTAPPQHHELRRPL